jgi:hypothetical protein
LTHVQLLQQQQGAAVDDVGWRARVILFFALLLLLGLIMSAIIYFGYVINLNDKGQWKGQLKTTNSTS